MACWLSGRDGAARLGDIDRIVALAGDLGAIEIVVGLPTSLSGTESRSRRGTSIRPYLAGAAARCR
jgi:RNase H-fold protein (predicted Holliday junction resolvase)